MPLSSTWLLAALGLLLAWPARAAPAELAAPATAESAAALAHDLALAVELQVQRGWSIDRHELAELVPTALESLCRVPPAARVEARRQLQTGQAAVGGDVRAALRRADGDLAALGELLLAHRTLLLLDRAEAEAGDCPWWLRPHARFAGRQTLADRLVVRLDGGGLGSLHLGGKRTIVGGGGSGRLLVGYGSSRRLAWLAGLEIGGVALVEDVSDPSLDVQIAVGLPVVLRWSRQWLHLDVDLAPVVHAEPDGDLLALGSRAGVLVAVSSLRLLDVLPWVGLGLGYERLWWQTAGAPGTHALRAGLRIGFDWDPGATARDQAAYRAAP